MAVRRTVDWPERDGGAMSLARELLARQVRRVVDTRNMGHATQVFAAFMVGLGASVSHAQPAERLTLVIFNQATEAVHVNVEEARCLEGADALDGRIVLIELPRAAASLKIVTEDECAAEQPVRLHITLTDLAGGNVGTIALDGSAENVTLVAESAKGFICTQTNRAGPASAPVFTARFRPCAS